MSTVIYCNVSGGARARYQLVVFPLFRLTIEHIASMLEKASDVVKATIFIELPENAFVIDEESAMTIL